MGYINTTNKIDHAQALKQHIWSVIDSIEYKVGLMAHEIPELKDKLQDYQDGKIKPLYFYNFLTKYFDEVNKL